MRHCGQREPCPRHSDPHSSQGARNGSVENGPDCSNGHLSQTLSVDSRHRGHQDLFHLKELVRALRLYRVKVRLCVS